ncbi:bifunctional 2-polyprenyl-6-hydroxyphenol methylase/3-demethylubiquinol 3-O-methyltransferase UbiG [Moraxella catarrhalis]|jgi:3-demethylubiquinone-9 3-O-methyltransferase|uniref:Ubiquinone biosynthesis O-methyltransferase n=1 Tax=Moraxella catarrhalis TaxID=480 RepID=A0A3A9L0C4_MORCA|nr:bifunctional 2-polyprenyl-6-hydroxyphenol methylase/3-demethylubiquinol 3-O-methyltransferase UbiG [Moraxella catarrhalis]ADG62081.1 3-demethylubiquinone-9 3-O-methyltransferase [Moraxella catarrhalis BBH18]AIK01214.1 3-demethylubiquinone-9 3-O-methyltransferase [Moraxella catarrhalis]ARB66888.1 bifunctional 2-polyprenyl-6-hydroxyphenol methylase/3-demethylubiquinol 3-O-methyltransferase UbiG [Moraxella catarrhalis]ARE66757.1 bifunctional 3-demethylubiquinone 3-O-methyltransferase/2-octapren
MQSHDTATINSINSASDTNQAINNADFDEISKFTKLADEWWDRMGAFKSLHDINPLRLNWIEDRVNDCYGSSLVAKSVVDIGCGGGILAHSMAVRGASVLGIDLGDENLKAAGIHAAKTGIDGLDFRCVAAEELAAEHASGFDVVTCMEMLEHVPDPSAIVQACYDLLKPGGVCVMSTINRNPKSYLFAIIGAEYVLNLVDKGTHDWHKFITPAELDQMAMSVGFQRCDLTGLHYNPITQHYWLSNKNVDVNYMMAFTKPNTQTDTPKHT